MMQYNRTGVEHRPYVEKHHEVFHERKFTDFLKLIVIVVLFVAVVLYIANMK